MASSFSLWFTYVIGRYLQSRTETQLEFIEDIKRYRTSAKHSTRLMTVLPIVTCVSVLFIMERVLGDYPFGWFGILVSGLFMLIFPLNLIFSGFLLASTYSSIRYIWHVASEVPIHLFRLASYACIAEPVMLVLGAFSVILSILGAMFMLVGEASGLRQGLELMLSLVVAIGLPFSFAVVAPVLILQRRIENVIQARRLEVVKLLEAESLGSSNESSPRVTETALLARLSHLDSMSTWPVGSQLKRFALFIILPPFTWVMAATLENLMFAG